MKKWRTKIALLLAVSLTLAGLPVAAPKAAGNAVQMVSLGSRHSGAITEDGSLWMWGANNYGQVGNGTTKDRLNPEKILDNVKTVSLGEYHSGAITEDGSLWMWGANNYGQVGDGTTENRTSPVKILDEVKTVSLGRTHSGAITKDGSLWMWGWNFWGQLGDGTKEKKLKPVKIMDNVKAISLGQQDLTAAITEDGSLWMWGRNFYESEDGTTENRLSPVKILDNVKIVNLGPSHRGAITEDGSLWMWGGNSYGQVGNGTNENRLSPVKILDKVKDVSQGSFQSGAIREDGSLWMWGGNSYGQVGNGTTKDRLSPIKILDNVKSMSLGYRHSGAITGDGSLWMWGDNDKGTLGDGTIEKRLSPVKISFSGASTSPDEGVPTGNRLQAPSLVSMDCDETEQVKILAFEENRSRLEKLVQGIVWRSSDPEVAVASMASKFVLPVKAKTFSSATGSYETWQSTGILKVKGLKSGTATITGSALDGETVSFTVTVSEPAESNTGTTGSGGGLELGEKKNASANQDVSRFFPADFELKQCVFPVEIAREDKEDGSYTIKGTVGIGRSDLLDNETKWNKYKDNIDNFNKYSKSYHYLDTFRKDWGTKTESIFRMEKFKKLPQVSMVGYFETTYDKNGNIIAQTGKIASDFEWNGSVSWQFVTPIGPVYLNVSGGGKISGEIGPAYDYAAKKLKIADGSLKITPSVALEGGYGIDKLAAIGAQGSLSLPVTLIPATKGELEAKASVHVTLVFVIDYTKDLATCKATLWDTTKKKELSAYGGGSDLSGGISLIDTSFAEQESEWNPTAEDAPMQALALEETASASYTVRTLQEGVLPSTLPMQAEIDGKQVLVFQAYDADRATVDSAVLKYSVLENGVWSKPQAVYDNGCADLFADMKVVNGKLVLAWQKEKSKIQGDVSRDSEAVMEEIATNAEIYCAVFDAETGRFRDPVAVTDNAVCDMMPKIVENSSDITISWVRNDAGSLMQQTGTNRIYTCVTDGTVCGEETLLTEAPGTIDQYLVYQEDGTEAVFSGTVDGVSALFDTDGNVYTAFEDLMREESDGTFRSLEYRAGKICFVQDGTLYVYDHAQQDLQAYKAGESAFGSELKYCTNGTKSGYVWSVYDEETNTGKLLTSMATPEGYSEPVVICEAKDSIWRHYAPILGADGTWKVIVNTEKATPAESADASVQLHALQYITKTEEEKVELQLGSVQEFDQQNGKTAVEYLVTNTGDKVVQQVVVELTAEDGTKISEQVPVDLQPGESALHTTYIDLSQITGKPGAQDVTLGVHAGEQKDLSGTTMTDQVGKADVAVSASFTETEEQVTVKAQLTNNGEKDALTTLKLFADETKKETLQTEDDVRIRTGETKEVTFIVGKKDIAYSETDAAYLTLEAVVDGGDYKESDNTAYVILYQNEEPQMNFTDVHKGDWYYDSIDYVNKHKLMTGLNETMFGAVQMLARAQFAVILHRMNEEPKVPYEDKFKDVPEGQWYTDAVLWANSIGVVNGYTDSGLFGTADNINREQMAVMMYRYADHRGYDLGGQTEFDSYLDASSVSGFAQEAMKWAVGNGIITGKDNGTRLDPQGYASRAECATIIMRFVEKYEK